MNFMDMINNSVCRDCKHRVSRVISSEGLALQDDDGKPLNFDNDDLEIRSEICSLLSLDLDHKVLSCSGYSSKYKTSNLLFKGEEFMLT
jgi:hypothetical protein